MAPRPGLSIQYQLIAATRKNRFVPSFFVLKPKLVLLSGHGGLMHQPRCAGSLPVAEWAESDTPLCPPLRVRSPKLFRYGRMTETIDVARRRFFQLGLAAAACGVVALSSPSSALAAMPRVRGVRTLALHNLHTDEKLRIAYWKDGVYSRPALARINHILRDHRSGDEADMSPRLFDLLNALQERVENKGAIEIISGYRSPKTNALLASLSDGVARHSFHTRGMAMDIRLPGTSLSHVQKAALSLRRGGVGYYPDSGFVHVDVGPVRRW